jgi:luciferase family oxidoreductase group 1
MSLPLSILDLATIGSGSTATQALQDSVELAKRGEQLGYKRHWFAEHHGMPSIATSTPELLMKHVAQVTDDLRVGSGGVMLPNHTPIQVAERFHTLEALHPGRIDLGIGRAPGSNTATMRAVRPYDSSNYPDQLRELMSLSRGGFPEDHPFHGVRVMPDDVELPPIWMLGSSGGSAKLAGQLGVGYGFATHFSPSPVAPALNAYRKHFEPSEAFPEPHIMLAVSVVCAPTDEEADHLAGSLDLSHVRRMRGDFSPLPSPEEAAEYDYSMTERRSVEKNRNQHFVGSPETVHGELRELVDETGADELMVTSIMHSPENRVRSFELLAESMGKEE